MNYSQNHGTKGEMQAAANRVYPGIELFARDVNLPEALARLRQNPLARRVKLADLTHNSDLACLEKVTDQDRRRKLKYRMARAILEDDQYDERLGLFRKILPLSLEYPLFLSVFCDRKGTVEKYRIDLETAKDSHYELDPQQGEKLRLALASGSTLPQALADWAEKGCSCSRVESMLRHCGVVFRRLHL